MLIAQTSTEVTQLLQVEVIGHEGSYIVLLHLRVGSWQGIIGDARAVFACYKRELRSSLQLSLPYRVSQHQFSCPQSCESAIVLLHRMVVCMVNEFVDMIIHVSLVRQEIHVQVNAHLAYLTVIIGIALPIVEGVAMLVLSRIIVFLLLERLTLDVRLHHQVCGGIETVIALDSDTYRVVFGYLPIETQVIVNPIVLKMIPRMRILNDVQNSLISRQIV